MINSIRILFCAALVFLTSSQCFASDSLSHRFNIATSLTSLSQGVLQSNIDGYVIPNKLAFGTSISASLGDLPESGSLEYFAQTINYTRIHSFNSIGFYALFQVPVYKNINIGVRPSIHSYRIYQYAREEGSKRAFDLKHSRGKVINLDLLLRYQVSKRFSIECAYFANLVTNIKEKYEYKHHAFPYTFFEDEFVDSYPLRTSTSPLIRQFSFSIITHL